MLIKMYTIFGTIPTIAYQVPYSRKEDADFNVPKDVAVINPKKADLVEGVIYLLTLHKIRSDLIMPTFEITDTVAINGHETEIEAVSSVDIYNWVKRTYVTDANGELPKAFSFNKNNINELEQFWSFISKKPIIVDDYDDISKADIPTAIFARRKL